MSWKYSTSYIPRDHSSSRESSKANFGVSNSKLGFTSNERQNGWSSNSPADSRVYRNPVEAVEHSPVWAKTNIVDGPSSVQKLKERYNTDEIKREIKPIKRADTKDLSSSRSIRPYGRSLTSCGSREGACESGSYFKFRRFEKALEPEKKLYGTRPNSSSNLENNCKVSYVPTATSKILTRKYSNGLNQTTLSLAAGEKFGKNEKTSNDEDFLITVTRGTSPTPITSSVYLRSRRSDYGLEKKVPKPRKKPEMIDKEIQTDKEISLYYSKYCNSEDSGFSKPWSSYSDKYSFHKSNFGFEGRKDQLSPHFTFGQTEAKRSISREESSDPTTPESPHKSLTIKPLSAGKTPPISPIKESDKKIFIRKSSPSNIGSSLKLDCAKTESVTNPNTPTHSCYSLQRAITKTNTLHHPGESAPKVTDNHSSNMDQAFDDVSSLSESSEEETSTDEETNPELVPAAMTVKKSITNFLQNIPNFVPQCQSKTNLYQRLNSLSPQQVNFRRIESGEKAWWMENTERTADDIPKLPSMRLMPNQDHDVKEMKTLTANNFLSPPCLINRQFSNDKDWLKSCDDLCKNESRSPSEDRWSRKNEFNKESLGKGSLLRDEIRRESNDVIQSCEQYNKSSENSLGKDTSNQMKFNEQSSEVFKDEMKYFGDFPGDCSVKNVSLKLQNGLGSPVEDKSFLEPGDISGMISKAKASLTTSKSKLDIKKSSSREMSPKITDAKSEIDLYWKELADSLDRPLRLCDLDFTDLNSDDEVDIFGNFKMNGEVPPPPPMLILPVPNKNMCAPAPPTNSNQLTTRTSRVPAPPPVPQIVKNKKTVKLFWKEVKDEPSIQTKMTDGIGLIWDELAKVKVDTQKLEYLFESRAKDLSSKKQQEINKNKEIIVLDPKRSNAINIGMTKLPPPRAIKTAILKMDPTVVNKEGIEKLLTMLPTEEEKIRIQDAQNLNPDIPLGSAEQFLLTLASINELEARLRLWAFKLNFETSEKEICEPLMDLKQGMEILKTNKTFRGILSTLLSVGNFLNGYDVKGFQIEYLSKVPEVKDTVHKHSLLHHLCIIVMEKFPESSDLYSEIGAVTRASKVDFDELASNLKKIEEECKLSWKYLKMIAKHEGHTAMKVKMSDFLADCAERIIVLGKVHKRIMSRFQKFAFWLGVPMNRISTTRPNEIFKVISEFALEYRTTRDRVLQQIKKINREKSRTRGYQAVDTNDTIGRKMNSREAKDDAMLKELLRNETSYADSLYNKSAWRRQKRDTKFLLEDANNNDEEILETLIKTANQTPSSRATLRERRRSRTYDRYYK